MKIYFILLFFSSQALALQCFEDESSIHLFSEEILKAMPQKACPSVDEAIFNRVLDEYKRNYGNEAQVIQSVKGFSLKGSQKEIELANTMLGKNPPKRWNTAVANCETVLCAFEKLLNSKEAAMQMFNIHAKSGYLLSLDQTINQNMAEQIWSPKEIREMDAGISKLPPELTKLNHLKVINRMADGLRRSGNENTGGLATVYIPNYRSEAELIIYDTGMDGLSTTNPYNSRSWPQEVLLHELCHHYDYQGFYATNYQMPSSEQRSFGFSQLSGWKKNTLPQGGDEWVHAPEAEFVSSYAATDIKEDFAESCMNYILNPEQLKNKAPRKYAFMKDDIFNKKVFDNEIWSNREKAWPSLGAALQQEESNCSVKLSDCTGDIGLNDGDYCLEKNCGSLRLLFKNSTCLNEYKEARLKAINEVLHSDEKYCYMNGEEMIRASKDRLCENSVNELISTLEKFSEQDLHSEISKCEKNKDYTNECVSRNLFKEGPVGEIINRLIPDRMKAISNELSALNTGKWLKPCLNITNRIRKQMSSGKEIYSYEPKSSDYSAGYLAEYINYNKEKMDINMACSREMLKVLETEGYKTPTANTQRLFNDEIKTEVLSFGSDVLSKITSATRGCSNQDCKTQKITELLQAWENEDLLKRKGFATKEVAIELENKFR